MKSTLTPIVAGLLAAAFVLTCAACAVEPMRVQHLWEIDPDLGVPWLIPNYTLVHRSNVRDIESVAALDRLRSSQWLRYASENNLATDSGSIDALLRRLRAGEANPQVRQAVVSAACGLAANEHVAELWKLVGNDPVNAGTVEQVLVRLRHPAAKELWRERIGSDDCGFKSWLTACEGLAVVGDQADVASLEKLIFKDKLPTPLRVAAARTLGILARSGQSSLADKVLKSNLEERFLIAANVLLNQPADEAVPLLERIITDGSTAAQGVAYTGLCNVARDPARQLAEKMVKHTDNTVRITALKHLQTFDDVASMDVQATCFSDVNPRVRAMVRHHLLAKSTVGPELRKRIDEIITFHLGHESWQAIEQAILLSAELGDRTRCNVLLKLLDHPMGEVFVPAAWALRVLADSSEVYAQMFQHVQLWTDRLTNRETVSMITNDVQHLMAHLMEALGDRHYEPVERVLQLYVPKNDFRMGYVTRIGAVWAIGKYWKDGDNEQLIQLLAERAADKASMVPEADAVRYTATLAIGWIADQRSRKPLLDNNELHPSPIAFATDWAIQRIDAKKK